MKRLTEKDYCGYDIKDRQNFNGYDDDKDCQKIFSCLQKLGKLEDIEENYKISLDRLVDILTNGIVIKVAIEYETGFYDYEKFEGTQLLFNIQKGLIWAVYEDTNEIAYTLYFKNYGKTWALTKEELEGK